MEPKYLEINLDPKVDPEDVNFAVNKAINRLHGIFHSQKIRAGIDLPLATSKYLGTKVRIIGRQAVLNAVLNNAGMRELEKRRMIRLQGIEDIPQNARRIQVKRVRNKDNNELLKKARKKRNHLISKGVDPKELDSVQTLKSRMQNSEQLPYFLIERNNKKHSVFFDWKQITQDITWREDGFNSYGLSSNINGFAYRF